MFGPGGIGDRRPAALPTGTQDDAGAVGQAPRIDPAAPSLAPAIEPNLEPSVAPSADPQRADAETVREGRTRALGAEGEARARLEQTPTDPSGPRAARGLSRTPAPPADLEARVDALEAEGRRGAFAESPEAAAAYARRLGEVSPHLDAETRRHLQRPLDDYAAAAARTQDPQALAVTRELAPALGAQGTEAFARVLLESPDARAREGAVAVLDRVARDNADPVVRDQAARGILNDATTVEQALRGQHPTLSRDRIADLAATRPERTNQLLDRARDLDPAIEAELLGRGLERTQLAEVGGVVGGIIDGVEGLAAPFVSPLETARGVGRLVGNLATDPVGTGRAIVEGAVDAIQNDPARAVTGVVVGLAGGAVGHARRASTAGRLAGRVDGPEPARVAATERAAEGAAARAAGGYQHGGVRAQTALEFEAGLEAAGYRRVLGGDMQHVFERNGEFVKVANPGRPENRQHNPAWAAARDAENTQGVTDNLAMLDRMRREYPGMIPETRRIGPTAYVQEGAPGMDVRQLPLEQRDVAARNAGAMLDDARRRFGRAFDPNIYNFRFDATGRVVSWFDPL